LKEHEFSNGDLPMKKIVLLASCFLISCQDVSQSVSTSVSQVSLPDISAIELPENADAKKMTREYLGIMDKKMALATEIGRIETRDQYVREVFIDMFSDPNLDPEVRAQFQQAGGVYVQAIDEINTKELKIVMKDWTWRQLVESENRLAGRAFSIVQHTNDDAFQEETLAHIKPLAEEGLMEGQQYALMYDRVNLKKNGGKQLYGTQAKCVNGQHDVHNLSDPDNVNERRKTLKMEPLEQYLEELRELYGPCKDE